MELNPAVVGATFVVGLMWGSFFNVCIARIPENESVVRPRSRCPRCKTPIPWHGNIPVLSYLWLRGKCAECRGTISVQYPLVELATGGLFVLLLAKFGVSFEWLAYTVFASLLLVITVIDLHHQIIPDGLSLGGLIVGFLASCLLPQPGLWSSLLGIALGGGIFLAVAMLYEKMTGREGLGGGDVKLLAMIGAWLGHSSILPVIIFSSATGSVVGIALMLMRKRDLKSALPFGPFLAAGALVFLFLGDAFTLL